VTNMRTRVGRTVDCECEHRRSCVETAVRTRDHSHVVALAPLCHPIGSRSRSTCADTCSVIILVSHRFRIVASGTYVRVRVAGCAALVSDALGVRACRELVQHPLVCTYRYSRYCKRAVGLRCAMAAALTGRCGAPPRRAEPRAGRRNQTHMHPIALILYHYVQCIFQ
jgi:hypothetical protein